MSLLKIGNKPNIIIAKKINVNTEKSEFNLEARRTEANTEAFTDSEFGNLKKKLKLRNMPNVIDQIVSSLISEVSVLSMGDNPNKIVHKIKPLLKV
ncbi:hypothetical protein HDU92_008758 [Lobulomyces angularis]|nr:hypothetical protein HDU92_008758 [Lobulomyces angularis]